MRSWLVALALVSCISLLLVAFGPLDARASSGNMSEDDFRKLEQTWLDAASVPDQPNRCSHQPGDIPRTNRHGRRS